MECFVHNCSDRVFGSQSPLEGIPAVNFLMPGEENGSPVKVMRDFFLRNMILSGLYILCREIVDPSRRACERSCVF